MLLCSHYAQSQVELPLIKEYLAPLLWSSQINGVHILNLTLLLQQCGYCNVGPDPQRKEDIRAETSGNEISCNERMFAVKHSHVAIKSEPQDAISKSLCNYTSTTKWGWVASRLFNIYCYHTTHCNSASKKGVRDSSFSHSTHTTVKNRKVRAFISALNVCYPLSKMNHMYQKGRSYICSYQ